VGFFSKARIALFYGTEGVIIFKIMCGRQIGSQKVSKTSIYTTFAPKNSKF
jgi:hypothetical protein